MKVKVYDYRTGSLMDSGNRSAEPDRLRAQKVLMELCSKGIEVERYNLARQRPNFMRNPVVAKLLKEQGQAILPITLVGDKVIQTAKYPSRDELRLALGEPF